MEKNMPFLLETMAVALPIIHIVSAYVSWIKVA